MGAIDCKAYIYVRAHGALLLQGKAVWRDLTKSRQVGFQH
jgi:hypothetical protein